MTRQPVDLAESQSAVEATKRVARVVARLPRLLTEADDYSWVPLGDVMVALFDIDLAEFANPEGQKPMLLDGLLRLEALEAVAVAARYLDEFLENEHITYEIEGHAGIGTYTPAKEAVELERRGDRLHNALAQLEQARTRNTAHRGAGTPPSASSPPSPSRRREPRMSEPRTAAGRALIRDTQFHRTVCRYYRYGEGCTCGLAKTVANIEAEAAAPLTVERLAEALHRIKDARRNVSECPTPGYCMYPQHHSDDESLTAFAQRLQQEARAALDMDAAPGADGEEE